MSAILYAIELGCGHSPVLARSLAHVFGAEDGGRAVVGDLQCADVLVLLSASKCQLFREQVALVPVCVLLLLIVRVSYLA